MYIFYKIYIVGRQRSSEAPGSTTAASETTRPPLTSWTAPPGSAEPIVLRDFETASQPRGTRASPSPQRCGLGQETFSFFLPRSPREVAAPPWSKDANKFEMFKSLCVFAQQEKFFAALPIFKEQMTFFIKESRHIILYLFNLYVNYFFPFVYLLE